MSGTARMRQPRTEAEWARDTARRIESLENPMSTRVGHWVITTDYATGNLVARHAYGGGVLLSRVPEPGTDPDATTGGGAPILRLRRTTTQSIAANVQVPVLWDSVDIADGGWNVGSSGPIQDIFIPTDGLYLLTYKLAWTQNTVGTKRAAVFVNGTDILDAQEVATDTSVAVSPINYITNTHQLTAGSWLTFTAHPVGSGPHDIGPAQEALNVTTLSLVCLREG